METIVDNNSANELINFKSGVNLGYSLASWGGSPNTIETINSIVRNNPQSAFCRGLDKGYERAVFDRQNDMSPDSDSRMSELDRFQGRTKENKDLER